MTKLTILYEDNHIIVVEKPSNVLSQSDHTKDLDLLSMVKSYIKETYHKPGNVYCGLVHRLDRPVGGIMVFAKTSKAASRLSKEIREKKFIKKYLAVVEGIIEIDQGSLHDYLLRLEQKTVISSKNKGQEACLDYTVLERNRKEQRTLVEINLKTGRHHQIRVQFAHFGHPLCGDQRYHKQDRTPIALFAYYLKFKHPVQDKTLEFSLLPKEKMYWTDFTLSNHVKEK